MSKDITGQKYGKLTAIKLYHTTRNGAFWLCPCECGNTCVVSEDNLKAGKMTSCGCVRESKRSLIGKKFGKLTVLAKTDERYSDGSILYECLCDCGNIVKTTSSRLKSGHVKSCGCEHYLSEDLTGKTFNHLKVTGYSHSSGHKAFWNCLCDCGKTTVVRGDYLKNGNTVSCGCIAEQTLNAGRTELKKAFVDGTNVRQISPDRKLNSNNKTGVKGVCWSSQKQKYRAQITLKGKVYHLGFYDKLEDAAKARKQAEEKMFGSFVAEHTIEERNF